MQCFGGECFSFLNDMVGFLAAAATVMAFYCRQMVTLRIAAIVANILFIEYAVELGLKPVLFLHLTLLPLNLMRLAACLRERRDTAAKSATPNISKSVLPM